MALTLEAPPARADVSSWLFTGMGPTWRRASGDDERWRSSLQFDVGMGTDPSHSWMLGAGARTQTHFGDGTDLSLLLRAASHGYVNGEWGIALDAGGLQRWWGESVSGFTGGVGLGAPWGITLSASGVYAQERQRGFSIALGVDLARLTVYRRSGSSWWRNSFPAYRPESESQPSNAK